MKYPRRNDSLFVVSDSELKMTRDRDDTLFLVITGGISCKLENLGSEVFKNSSKITRRANMLSLKTMAMCDMKPTRCTCTDTLCVVAFLEKTMDTTNGELERGFAKRD